MPESKLDFQAIREAAKQAKEDFDAMKPYEQEAVKYVSDFAASEESRKALKEINEK